jgi:hypothetical protein
MSVRQLADGESQTNSNAIPLAAIKANAPSTFHRAPWLTVAMNSSNASSELK